MTVRAKNIQPVAIVGAGPGDPDLLTRRAYNLLTRAEVVLYDRLVTDAILELLPSEALAIEVGKSANGNSWHQDAINVLLVEQARTGKRVVRLKSGDPMVFGRADEELDALQLAKLPYEVVPGITAASAASAAIGTSLTRRNRNSALSLLTAHDLDGFAEQDWRTLARSGSTAAVYMGVKAARFFQGRLLLHGAASNTPMCVVENASRPNQQILNTSLEHLHRDIVSNKITGPAVIFLGLAPRSAELSVASLRQAV